MTDINDDITEFNAGHLEKTESIMNHFGERKGWNYSAEAFAAAAEYIVEKHPLRETIKTMSKGDVNIAANIIRELHIAGDHTLMEKKLELRVEDFLERAREMLR